MECELKAEKQNNTALSSFMLSKEQLAIYVNSLLKVMDIGKRNVSSVYGVKSELNIWIDVLRLRKQSVQSHIILSILFMYIHLYVEYSSGPLSTAIEKDTKWSIIKINNEGISKLTEFGNKAVTYKNKVKTLTNLSKNYKGFASDNSDSTLFIYKISK